MDVRVGMPPEQLKKVAHDLVELLFVAACVVGQAPIPARKSKAKTTIPKHGCVENSLRCGRDVALGDDQRRVRTECAARNLAVLRQFVLNLLRTAPVRRKCGLTIKRLVAATADYFRAELLGLL